MKNYALRLVPANGEEIEEKVYSSHEDALHDFVSFREDKSRLYKYVALLDVKSNLVIRILQFENGQLRIDLSDGDIVRLREGHYEQGEEKYLYKVSDINENTGRCLIVCVNSGATIPAAESVCIGMIDTFTYSKEQN